MKDYTRNLGTRDVGISFGDLAGLPSTDYRQRHLDIGTNEVSAGMQKLADRFILVLFSIAGSTKHDETYGTSLMSGLLFGSSMNFGLVQSAAAIAVAEAAAQLSNEDSMAVSPYTEELRDDEMLESAECTGVSYNPKESVLRLYVSLTNKAGESYTYMLPASLEMIS